MTTAQRNSNLTLFDDPNTHRAGKRRKSPYGAITMCYRQNARTTPKPARVHCGCWRRVLGNVA